jgi:hypothetical protein
MGDHARGTIVTQVFPYERSLQAPIVKEASDLAAKASVGDVTPATLEGFAGAKVLVEGLRPTGLEYADLSIINAEGKFRR